MNNKRYADVKTMEQSLALSQKEAPCLLTLARKSSEKFIASGLVLHLRELDKFLNLKNGMSDEVLIFTAEGIIEEYGGSLSFADVKIVLDKAKRGGFGKMYERLDCPTVMGWFREYCGERLNAAEQRSYNRDKQQRREAMRGDVERDPEMYAELARMFEPHKIAALSREELADAESEYNQYKKLLKENGGKLIPDEADKKRMGAENLHPAASK